MSGSVLQPPRHTHLYLILLSIVLALVLLLVSGDTPVLSGLLG